MRNQLLRLFLLHRNIQSRPHIFRVSQVNSLQCARFSILHLHAPLVVRDPFIPSRYFSSSPNLAVEPPKPPSNQTAVLLEIFAKPEKSSDEIKLDLDCNDVVMTHDLILSVLGNANTDAEVAKRLFNWVLDNDNKKLSSKSYNFMLEILGSKGFVKESWDMIGIMKKKGYGVSKSTFDRISEKFKAEGLQDDVEKMKALYMYGSASIKNNDSSSDNSVEKVCSKVCDIIKSQIWTVDVEKQLQEAIVEFSRDLVVMVLDNLKFELNKGLIFFRWMEENGLFKHDQETYSAMAKVLCREELTDKFWKVLNEMRSAGFGMERETYSKVLEQLLKRKLIMDAVDLYEFAMTGGDKPSVPDSIFLLKKIAVSREFNVDLFAKVVTIFRKSGYVFTDANMNSIIKSLTSVGRLTDCNKLLKTMMDCGYVPSISLQSKVAFTLSSGGNSREAREFMESMGVLGGHLDHRAWGSLLKGCCESRDLNEALETFQKMMEQEGNTCSAYALDLMVGLYCRKNRPLDAYKLVSQMVDGKGLRPWQTTFKSLTSKLLVKKRFEAALHILDMMKNQGYPPDLDSFVEYLSKAGSAAEAITYSQAMTSKRFPSKSVFLRLFEAYFKAGRKNEAQDFLSKCPSYIKNNADVLNLFCAMKY